MREPKLGAATDNPGVQNTQRAPTRVVDLSLEDDAVPDIGDSLQQLRDNEKARAGGKLQATAAYRWEPDPTQCPSPANSVFSESDDVQDKATTNFSLDNQLGLSFKRHSIASSSSSSSPPPLANEAENMAFVGEPRVQLSAILATVPSDDTAPLQSAMPGQLVHGSPNLEVLLSTSPEHARTQRNATSGAVPANSVHMLSSAHDFSIDTAQIAGRDLHIHYEKKGAVVAIPKIATWLTSKNHRKYHTTTVSLRAANTGLWFFEMQEFQDWLAAEHATLWVTGMPGAGKTVLASHSVDRLAGICKKEPDSSSAYFYCRYIDNCTAGDLLATFVRQLLEDHDRVYTVVREVYDVHQRRQIRLTASTAIEILEGIVPLFKRIYIILDGLDEMPEDEKMSVLEFLKRLPIHLLIFSRPMEAFSGILASVTTFSIQARNGDIEACVLGRISSNHRLRKLLQDDQSSIHKIIAKIQLKSRGMFLVAALQIEALAGSTNIASLMSALESLPTGLHDMYAWTLRRIRAQPPEESLLAQKVLLWLTYSKATLRMVDLQRALATSYNAGGGIYDPESITPAEIILTACCGLVSTGAARTNPRWATWGTPQTEVKLIHYTTREYLEGIATPPFSQFAAITTSTCLAYISSMSKQSSRTLNFSDDQTTAIYPFLQYALTHWPEHAKDVDCTEDADTLRQLCSLLDGISHLPCRNWHHGTMRHTPFQFAVCRGLLELLPLLQCRDEILSESVPYPSLHLAIHLDRPDAVRALIFGPRHSPVDINIRDKEGRTPLILAITEAAISIIELLLSHPGLDVNLPDIRGSTPLFTAMEHDQNDILQMLLSHPKCDPNRRINGTHSLRMVSRWAFQVPPIEVQVGWGEGAALLILASLSGRRNAVELLLAHASIDVNARTDNGDHSLSWLTPSSQIFPKLPPQLTANALPDFQRADSLWFDHRIQAAVPILCHPSFNPILIANKAGTDTLLILASKMGCETSVRALLPHCSPRTHAAAERGSTGTEQYPPAMPLPPDKPRWQSALRLIIHPSRLLQVLRGGGDVRVVTEHAGLQLQKPKIDVNACDRQGMTALYHAQTISILELLLSCPHLDPNHQDSNGNTVLIYACNSNNLPIVKLLLSRPDIVLGAPNRGGTTALMVAAKYIRGSSSRLVRLLVEHPNFLDSCNVHVNQQDASGMTALHWAVHAGKFYRAAPPRAEASIYLLSLPGVNVNILNCAGDASIHLASYHGASAIIGALLKHPNISVNMLNGHGNTPLHIVCQLLHVDACIILLQHPDLDLGVKNRKGNCAIHSAAEQGDVAIVQALLMHDATNVNAQNAAGSTPLHIACQFSRVAVTLALLRHPDLAVDVRDLTGNCAIHVAAEKGDACILQTLFQHQATDPNLPNAAGDAPIHIVSRCSRVIASLSLMKNPHLGIHTLDRKGNAAIHIAAEHGDAHMVQALLCHVDADPNIPNSGGHTPLHIAARLSTERSGPVLVVLLSDARIDVNLRDREGYAAVDILSMHKDHRPLQLVLSHPNIEANPLEYRRNFYSSCWRVIHSSGSLRQRASDWKRISSFLKYDPECVRLTDADGKTVLHHAAKVGCEELVERILAEFWAWVEVDVRLCDKEGKSLIDYGTEGPHTGITELLDAATPSWFCLFGDY